MYPESFKPVRPTVQGCGNLEMKYDSTAFQFTTFYKLRDKSRVFCGGSKMTSCETSMSIWRGILRRHCRTTGEHSSLLRSMELTATTEDCLVLSDGAHRTRNSYKLRCRVLFMGEFPKWRHQHGSWVKVRKKKV